MSSSSNDLPSSVTSYKPQILKIKIGPFRPWIEKRLTELLDGMEDEILWSLVFNYLEDAQKRSKREGPAANPSGGLNAKEIQTALSGFLGPKQSRDFTAELFTLLAKAEASDTGIPPEFNMSTQDAQKEAFGIIQSKRKEMELSDRVRREIRRTDYHNDHRGRDYRDRDHHRDHRDHRDSRDRRDHEYRDRHYEHKEHRDSRDRNYEHREHRDSKDRDYEYREHRDSRDREYERGEHEHRRRHRDSSHSPHDRHRHRYDDDRHPRRYRDDDYERSRDNGHHDYRSDRRHRDNYSRSHDPIHRSKSPIPSSSPESPSPCWETTLDSAKAAAPRAPIVQENVSSELESALKARALKALLEKRQ